MTEHKNKKGKSEQKKVIYQVFTRLFGNTNTNNKPWGTIEENGVGKFKDFTDKALQEIRDLGITHIWYTGVPHHALINDYSEYGISSDDPDVVKGRAGSPYSVKDYYQVNPDLATDPANRLGEFKDLIDRTHRHGMKVLIDMVPNHTARRYQGLNNPEGVADFGSGDDSSVAYRRDNNYYYIPGESFQVPEPENGYRPLGGAPHPLADGKFEENPAKWTGNGSRLSQPHFHDWFETAKVNYGITPDGDKDFSLLPGGFDLGGIREHFDFWQGQEVPDSWIKLRDIALYWMEMGIDGFRFDMAEMVPVEFFSYLNSAIKLRYPKAFLLAEVYNPALYREYLNLGKLDCLYDKVGLYDTLKLIMQGHLEADQLVFRLNELQDIRHKMLHFLENHDEQRIASPEFAGNAAKAKPAMVFSATVSTSPIMVYFGQEVGEPAAEEAGFGLPSRTSIFDYIGVPHHQRWVNHRNFDGGQLSEEERSLRGFYKKLLNFTQKSPALLGDFKEIHSHNRSFTAGYDPRIFSFLRWSINQKLLILVNFNEEKVLEFDLRIPSGSIQEWGLENGKYLFIDQLDKKNMTELYIQAGEGSVHIKIGPLESFIYEFLVK